MGYILPQYASDWSILKYGAGEIYVGGDITYNLTFAWTDKNIYLFDIAHPNCTIKAFDNREKPEVWGNNSWLNNTALVRTDKNIYIYNSFNHGWIIQSYITNDEKPQGGDSKNILALAWTNKTTYVYDALNTTWNIQSFDSCEFPQKGRLSDLSALIITDKKSYVYFNQKGWMNYPFIDNEESPKGGAVSFDLELTWTDIRMYVYDAAFEDCGTFQIDINSPEEYVLFQNYPNPFNNSTTIGFDVTMQCHVVLKIYNIKGQEIVTLLSKRIEAGRHKIKFDASQLPSGVYLYSIQIGRFRDWKKMLLIQ